MLVGVRTVWGGNWGLRKIGEGVPSIIPRPERRIGTREMVSGKVVVVAYSYPRWLLLCLD